ncbi:hypothetical protein JCM11491_000164 [Sporobolomyces phaffii]
MPNKTIHPPPCLFLRSPATRTHANPSPAFGLISTYSHRVPGRSVQPHQANRCLNHNDEGSRTRGSPDDNNRGGDESAFEFEQVAAASVSIPQPSPTRQMSFERLYLCPWESNEPPATAVRARATLDVRSAAKGGEAPIAVLEGGGKRTVGPGESRSGGFGYKQEKRYGADRPNSEAATTVVVEFPRSGKAEQEVGEQERREATRARNSYLVKLGIVTLLSIALMVDLVVINVRLFTREDWE